MKQTTGEQILAKHNREKRIDERMAIIDWLAQRWENFRLIQEAALWRNPGQPVPIDDDLAQRYHRSEGAILAYMQEAEKLGLVTIISDAAGASHAFQITQDTQSVAGQLIVTLFQ